MSQRITLGELFHRCATTYSERTCITTVPDGRQITYGQLEALINRLAHGLIAISPEAERVGTSDDLSNSCVAIMLENSIEYVALSYALKKINRVEVSVNRAFRGQALLRMLNLTETDTLITSAVHFDPILDVIDGLSHLRWIVVVGELDDAPHRFPHLDVMRYGALLAERCDHIVSPASDTDLAVIMFTSGTTGVSKGCMLSHRYAVRTAENMIEPFRLTGEDVNYTPYPLSHIGPAFYDMLPMFMLGGRVVLRDGFSLSAFWPEVARENVTWFMCLGSVQQLLYSEPVRPEEKQHKVTRCWSTPAPVPKQDFEARFNLHLIPGGGYGSTDAGWVVVPQWDHEGGVVLPHFEVAIIDANDDPVPAGVDGEMVIRPREAGVMSDGYFGMPERTLASRRNLWFHTGDIGCMDEEGLFYFRCRMAERIRVRGEMVSGFEVEEGLLCHPDIEDAAAVGIPSEFGEEDIRAFVTLKPAASCTVDDILQHCREHLAKFMVPAVITILDEMPRTSTGKPEKGVLQKIPL